MPYAAQVRCGFWTLLVIAVFCIYIWGVLDSALEENCNLFEVGSFYGIKQLFLAGESEINEHMLVLKVADTVADIYVF